MSSSQVLSKGNSSATLGPDRLIVKQGRQRKEIPLEAVSEVRADGGTALRVVLTDGAVHRLDGGNATATEAFRVALDEALPAERNPAGSSLVVTEREPSSIKAWQVWVGILLFACGYMGYVVWVGHSAPDPETWPLVLFAVFPLGVGLPLTLFILLKTVDRVALARRGITVLGAMTYHPNGRQRGSYVFTDTDGGEHTHQPTFGRSSESLQIVYDPRSPGTSAPRRPLPELLLMYFFGWIISLGILALGVLMVVAPFM
ncbi:hypothetical protein [Streptomyces sp. TBY4]|uniref:hypothetical protein n=1 Tax=Streptomyces sp. TBY4 TaxID=2962030 RepID=UPI0020B72E63|nr:hypothetical protein [Streptomyces sp. TBY4]MCP3758310.1 hypothetical protein [Streptomyces sp. TBY4]